MKRKSEIPLRTLIIHVPSPPTIHNPNWIKSDNAKDTKSNKKKDYFDSKVMQDLSSSGALISYVSRLESDFHKWVSNFGCPIAVANSKLQISKRRRWCSAINHINSPKKQFIIMQFSSMLLFSSLHSLKNAASVLAERIFSNNSKHFDFHIMQEGKQKQREDAPSRFLYKWTLTGDLHLEEWSEIGSQLGVLSF